MRVYGIPTIGPVCARTWNQRMSLRVWSVNGINLLQPTTTPIGPLHPLPVPDGRGDSVAMDFIGPLPQYFTLPQTFPDPGGSEWNGRNLVGIQVNSNLIPSKNNLIIQTQIFIHSRSFQVIPGGIQVFQVIPGGIQVFQVIPGGIQVKKRMIILATFQVYSHHIPGHSRSTPGSFQPHSGYIPAIFLFNSRSIYYSIY